MANKSTLLYGLLAATVAGALPMMASSVTYTYTGNDFVTVIAPYTTSDDVSGNFSLPTALPDNMAEGPITPASYSFSDGVQTFSSASPPTDVTFEVGTDASGDITSWLIQLQNGSNVVASNSSSSDFGETPVALGEIIGDPGTWQMSGGGTSPTPEPGNVAVIGLGLGAIALIARKRQRLTQGQ